MNPPRNDEAIPGMIGFHFITSNRDAQGGQMLRKEWFEEDRREDAFEYANLLAANGYVVHIYLHGRLIREGS